MTLSLSFEYHLPFSESMRIVELGGGDNPRFRPNVDVRPGPTVDIVTDLNEPLPLEDKSFDALYSCYAFEHVSWRSIKRLMGEAFRILKPGGLAVLILPNLLEQARRLVNKEEWEENDICMIFGGQDYGENAHANGYSPEYLCRLLKGAGFGRILLLPHPQTKTDIIAEAYRPATI